MFPNDRSALRKVYVDTWHRMQGGDPLDPMQQILSGIIAAHPEYHSLLSDGEDSLHRDWTPEQGETNPFLHMSMHSAITEQVHTDRPRGIRLIWEKLANRLGDHHPAEHQMMECLALMLWESQSRSQPPDEASYLECLRKLLNAQ